MTQSRQRKWQQAHEAAGLCRLCSRPAGVTKWCEPHRSKHNRDQFKKQREKRGVSLDVPKHSRVKKVKPMKEPTTCDQEYDLDYPVNDVCAEPDKVVREVLPLALIPEAVPEQVIQDNPRGWRADR